MIIVSIVQEGGAMSFFEEVEGLWDGDASIQASTQKSVKTKRVINALSNNGQQQIEDSIFVKQLLEEVYPEHFTEVEMLILSISNYTHREISEVLNISRLGVTKRIAKAREIFREHLKEMMGVNNE